MVFCRTRVLQDTLGRCQPGWHCPAGLEGQERRGYEANVCVTRSGQAEPGCAPVLPGLCSLLQVLHWQKLKDSTFLEEKLGLGSLSRALSEPRLFLLSTTEQGRYRCRPSAAQFGV